MPPSSPRPRASHGLEIEERFGYAQAIQTGTTVHVAGQVPRDERGEVISDSTLEAHVARATANVEAVLSQLGCTLADLVAVSAHVVDGPRAPWEQALDLCRRHFGPARAAVTVVCAAQLNNPRYLVEISAVALAPAAANQGDSVERTNVNTGSPLEERLGRSDAVRADNTIYIAGQPSWRTVGSDFPTQYRDALDRFADVVRAAGATPDDVASMHVYVTTMPDADDWNAVIDLHHDVFAAGRNRPASTMIGVPRVSVDGALVEISGVAVVDR